MRWYLLLLDPRYEVLVHSVALSKSGLLTCARYLSPDKRFVGLDKTSPVTRWKITTAWGAGFSSITRFLGLDSFHRLILLCCKMSLALKATKNDNSLRAQFASDLLHHQLSDGGFSA